MLVGAMGLAVYTLSDQAMAIVADVPKAAQRIRQRVREHRRDPDGAIQVLQNKLNRESSHMVTRSGMTAIAMSAAITTSTNTQSERPARAPGCA